MGILSRENWQKPAVLVGRLVMGGVFLVAGYSKVRPLEGMPWTLPSIDIALAKFAFNVEAYKILPVWAVTPVAHFLPIFEIVLAVWLIIGIGPRFSCALSAIAMFVFTSAMLSAYLRKLDIDCG